MLAHAVLAVLACEMKHNVAKSPNYASVTKHRLASAKRGLSLSDLGIYRQLTLFMLQRARRAPGPSLAPSRNACAYVLVIEERASDVCRKKSCQNPLPSRNTCATVLL
jgi:hypothetical protein